MYWIDVIIDLKKDLILRMLVECNVILCLILYKMYGCLWNLLSEMNSI